jgi:hypothetical protein
MGASKSKSKNKSKGSAKGKASKQSSAPKFVAIPDRYRTLDEVQDALR